MKRRILIFLLLCFGNFMNAQRDSIIAKHIDNSSVFVEFGGNAVGNYSYNGWPLLFSINYDRILLRRKLTMTSFRIGTDIPITRHKNEIDPQIIPIMINLLVGEKFMFLELGAGVEPIFFYHSNYKGSVVFTSVIGFRWQNEIKRKIFRVGITPTFGIVNGTHYRGFLAGLSFGYRF